MNSYIGFDLAIVIILMEETYLALSYTKSHDKQVNHLH